MKQNKKLENINIDYNCLRRNERNFSTIEELLKMNKKIICFSIKLNGNFDRDLSSQRKVLNLIESFPEVDFGYEKQVIRKKIRDCRDINRKIIS